MESHARDLEALVGALTEELDDRLAEVDADLARHYPGGRPGRQPVHTVYVPADRFRADLATSYGATALRATEEHEAVLLSLLDGDTDLLDRVRAKLGGEPVEDLRIDFEDGYGIRADDDEDDDVRAAAGARAVAGSSSTPESRRST